MKLSFDHIGIACSDAGKALALYRDLMGLEIIQDKIVEHMNLHVIKLKAGDTVIELLEPGEGEQVVSKFISTKGEGIHHICLKAENFEQVVNEMKSSGYNTVWSEPKIGASGKKVHFFSPKQTGGVLIEVSE